MQCYSKFLPLKRSQKNPQYRSKNKFVITNDTLQMKFVITNDKLHWAVRSDLVRGTSGLDYSLTVILRKKK